MRTNADWEQQAVCRTVDGELWFPAKGQPTGPAKRICRTCPVQRPCLDAALAEERGVGPDHRHGIRGGYAGRTRWRMQQERDQRAAAAPTT